MGGWDGELDVVALHPVTKHVLHIETSMDSLTWTERELRFAKKFARGRKYVPKLFSGIYVPKQKEIEQVVVLGYGGKGGRDKLGGAKIVLISELLAAIIRTLSERKMSREAVSEQFPLLRTLHFVARHKGAMIDALRTEFNIHESSTKGWPWAAEKRPYRKHRISRSPV